MHTKAQGLNLIDVMRTEALSLKCGKAILGFSPKSKGEPEPPPYCTQEPKTYVPADYAQIQQASQEASQEAELVMEASGDIKK